MIGMSCHKYLFVLLLQHLEIDEKELEIISSDVSTSKSTLRKGNRRFVLWMYDCASSRNALISLDRFFQPLSSRRNQDLFEIQENRQPIMTKRK